LVQENKIKIKGWLKDAQARGGLQPSHLQHFTSFSFCRVFMEKG
jgi:hypothetical protein